MKYLIRYRMKQDGLRHTFFAESFLELTEKLHEAAYLAENKEEIIVESKRDVPDRPL